MRCGFAPARSRNRFEEDSLAERAHFIDELFQAAVLGDGEAKGVRLLVGKSDRDSLGFDFASPAPGAGMTLSNAALADQIQGHEFVLAPLETLSKFGGVVCEKRLLFHKKILALLCAYIYSLRMRHSTPFFAAFGSLLFGKARLSKIKELLQENSPKRSLSEFQSALGDLIPKALLAPNPSKLNSRQRIFSPLVTFWAFLAQVLERGSSCRDALRRIIAWFEFEFPNADSPSPETSAYCQARARLEDATLQKIGAHMAQQMQRNTPDAHLWNGRRVKIVDGTTVSMPDTPDNQAQWPQTRSQKPGCGFPLLKLVGLFCLASGALLETVHTHMRQHEATLVRLLWKFLDPGDILLADRGFCSFFDLSTLHRRGVDCVMRMHQARSADFRRGRRLAKDDRLVRWKKPTSRPKACPQEDFDALPAGLALRMLRYRITAPGFRSKEIVLVTTLLDPKLDPLERLAELYFQRWSIELHFREIKTLLAMEVLRCLSPKMIVKELLMHRIAYNLVRALMQRAAITHDIPLERLSFKGTLDSLHHFADAIHACQGKPRKQSNLLAQLLVTISLDLLPVRPNRSEPRAKKRRPKNYQLLTRPRHKMGNLPHRNRPGKKHPKSSLT
jgi:hypothetical protein